MVHVPLAEASAHSPCRLKRWHIWKVLLKITSSTSEALDQLIREKKREAEKARVSAGIRAYYDSISDQERAENLAWGELAGSYFLKG